jgi:hypothetical protein
VREELSLLTLSQRGSKRSLVGPIVPAGEASRFRELHGMPSPGYDRALGREEDGTDK